MKKLLSIITAMAMCLSMLALVACNGGNEDEQQGAAAISVSSLSDYYVIRADVESTTECAKTLNQAIADKLSVTTKGLKTDFVVEGNDKYSVHQFEILIGETNREESVSFASELKYNEYGYAVIGEKIVIAGKPAEKNALAVEKFIADIIDAHEAGSDVFIAKNAKFINKIEYKFESITLNGTDIGEFDIVYKNTHGANEETLAKQLRQTIAELCGIEINAVSSTSSSVKQKQIVFYDSKNITSAMKTEKEELVKKEGASEKGIIVADENIVWLCSDNIIGLKASVDNLIQMFETSGNGNITVQSGLYDVITSEIKVMSFNVYVGTKGENSLNIMPGGAAQRRVGVLKTILNHMPDVVGVQEASNIWINYLSTGLKDTYAYVGTGREPHLTGSSANEGCQIFYNKNKYDVIETNTYWLSDTPETFSKYEESEYTRIMTYAIFERKSDGFRFMHVNTHLDFQAANAKQTSKMLELIDAVGFDGLTFVTGDFNSTSSSSVYKLMTNAGYFDSYNLAQISNEINVSGMIDFCFVKPEGAVVDEHCVARDMFDGMYPSDHKAVWATVIPSVEIN